MVDTGVMMYFISYENRADEIENQIRRPDRDKIKLKTKENRMP